MARITGILIRVAFAVSRLLDADFLVRLYKVYEGMLNNPAYPTPPYDMATFKAKIDAYSASVTAALDGGKAALAARDKQRADVSVMYHALGHYVEVACNNDMNTFVSSGFVAAARKQRSAPQPVGVPVVVAVKQGSTGQLSIVVQPVEDALQYVVHYTPLAPGATGPAPGATWTEATAPLTRPPIQIDNLTPGTTYVFQARAYGKLGYSDWSDPVSRMCI